MNRDEDGIFAEALRWHADTLRDDMDWDGFTAWLEADARHAAAYDAVALGDALIDEHRGHLAGAAAENRHANDDADAAPVPATPAPPVVVRRGWMRWAGMAIAASLAAVLVAPQIMPPPPQVYTTSADSRTVALEDGSSVLLAPHSTLSIEGRHQQRMALSGGAWFDIRHDPSRALAITAGGVEIGDIGTRFDVQEAAGKVRVEVAEGEVQVSAAPLAQPIRLVEGRGLVYDGKGGTAVVRPLGAEAIGEWRQGRLSFDGAPLLLVAADLSRYAGLRVTVAPGLRDRAFSGTLVIGDGEAALRDLSQVLGVDLRRGPDGLVLDERR